MDPFRYDSITLNFGESQLVNGIATAKNITSYGMSRAKVLRVKALLKDDEMVVQAEVLMPKISSRGLYLADMTVGGLKLNSKGQYNVTLKNVKIRWNLKGKLQKRNGEDYMKVYKMDIFPDAEDLKISLSGLFPDENLSTLFKIFKAAL